MAANQYVKENIAKNILVLIIAAFFYPTIAESLAQMRPEQTNDFLLIISMLLVTVCFASFAFTYEKSNIKQKTGKIIAYSATGIFMLLTALLLESIIVAVRTVYPFFNGMIFGFSIMLYIGIILYDFWDLLRVK